MTPADLEKSSSSKAGATPNRGSAATVSFSVRVW